MALIFKRSACLFGLAVLITIFLSSILSADPYESVYILPDESIELMSDLSLIEKKTTYCVGRYGFGIGATDKLSLLYMFDYVHSYFGSGGVSGPGDSHVAFRYAFFDFNNRFFSSITAGLTIPTGGNIYHSSEWSGLAFGNYELIAGMNCRYDFDSLVLSSSARYVFRQGKGEDAFFRRFFYGSHLRNDYGVCSASAMLSRFYPFTAWGSVSVSFRVWKKTAVEDEIKAEGCGVVPVPLSFGLRWFFTREAFISIYETEQLIKYSGYIRRSAGISLSFVF